MPRGSLPGERRGGRQKGVPNKKTVQAREVALAFLNRRTPEELDELWNKAKLESPSRAFGMWFNALEFVMPKLGRLEHVGDSGGAITVVVKKFEEA